MANSIAEFQAHAETYVRNDRFLSDAEWQLIVEHVDQFGLSEETAEHSLIRMCLAKGAKIERFAVREIETLVTIATQDGVLDGTTRAWIEEHGARLFEGAILSKTSGGKAPLTAQALVRKVLDARLGQLGRCDEAALADRLTAKLGASQGGTLARADWQKAVVALKAELSQDNELSEAALVDFCHRWRVRQGIEIIEPSAAAPLIPPPPPTPVTPILEQLLEGAIVVAEPRRELTVEPPPTLRPARREPRVARPLIPPIEEPEPTSNPALALLKMGLLSLLIALAVFGLLRWIERMTQ